LTLQLAHSDKAHAEHALDVAVDELRHIDAQLSLFKPSSAVSRLNAQGYLADPDPLLLDVLTLAQAVSRRSQGAFDVTVQPLWNTFARAAAQGRLPSAGEVAEARRYVGWQGLELSAQRIRFNRSGMGITLNGIAQGYAADRVKARWQALGVAHALINTGEWAALGRAPDQAGWQLGIANPRDERQLLTRVALRGQCVATSSDAQTAFSQDLKNHHIFDPHTGYSPTDLASVTVLADNTASADALTKVMFVAGMHQALALARNWGVEVILVDKAGRLQTSAGLAA